MHRPLPGAEGSRGASGPQGLCRPPEELQRGKVTPTNQRWEPQDERGVGVPGLFGYQIN